MRGLYSGPRKNLTPSPRTRQPQTHPQKSNFLSVVTRDIIARHQIKPHRVVDRSHYDTNYRGGLLHDIGPLHDLPAIAIMSVSLARQLIAIAARLTPFHPEPIAGQISGNNFHLTIGVTHRLRTEPTAAASTTATPPARWYLRTWRTVAVTPVGAGLRRSPRTRGRVILRRGGGTWSGQGHEGGVVKGGVIPAAFPDVITTSPLHGQPTWQGPTPNYGLAGGFIFCSFDDLRISTLSLLNFL